MCVKPFLLLDANKGDFRLPSAGKLKMPSLTPTSCFGGRFLSIPDMHGIPLSNDLPAHFFPNPLLGAPNPLRTRLDAIENVALLLQNGYALQESLQVLMFKALFISDGASGTAFRSDCTPEEAHTVLRGMQKANEGLL